MSLHYFARHRPFHNLFILFIAHEARDPHLRALEGGQHDVTGGLIEAKCVHSPISGRTSRLSASAFSAAAAEEPMITPIMANTVRKLIRMFLLPLTRC